jgi:hypothetical protein
MKGRLATIMYVWMSAPTTNAVVAHQTPRADERAIKSKNSASVIALRGPWR